jgi:hypothetical protein
MSRDDAVKRLKKPSLSDKEGEELLKRLRNAGYYLTNWWNILICQKRRLGL